MREEEVKVTCDLCGKEIHGDYMTLTACWGEATVEFTIHNPRTAPIDPCGNQTLRRLAEWFQLPEGVRSLLRFAETSSEPPG